MSTFRKHQQHQIPCKPRKPWMPLWIIWHKGETISCRQWKICLESIHQGCSMTRTNNIILPSQCTFSERNRGKTHPGLAGYSTSNYAARNLLLATSNVDAPLAICNENGKWCDECGANKKGQGNLPSKYFPAITQQRGSNNLGHWAVLCMYCKTVFRQVNRYQSGTRKLDWDFI